jgi:hypothetical protein
VAHNPKRHFWIAPSAQGKLTPPGANHRWKQARVALAGTRQTRILAIVLALCANVNAPRAQHLWTETQRNSSRSSRSSSSSKAATLWTTHDTTGHHRSSGWRGGPSRRSTASPAVRWAPSCASGCSYQPCREVSCPRSPRNIAACTDTCSSEPANEYHDSCLLYNRKY